jgi:LPS export ABC transporter permease LptG/LPS export ABC transporter permease LptF
MLRTLDRYIIREILPPFVLVLLIFTFLLVLPPLMTYLENLLAKGVSWPTAARIILTLVPQALGLTIPMALLVGLLIGLGRLSADREAVALLACGVSPYRLLRPVGLIATAAGAATLYVMLVAIPDANQTFREITFDIITKKFETDIRPRVFFQDFPGWVLYARDEPEPGVPGWKDLMVADTRKPSDTMVYFAERGRVMLDRGKRQAFLILERGTRYSTNAATGEADTLEFQGEHVLTLDPDTVFPQISIQRGPNEKTIDELKAEIAQKIPKGISPHPEIIAWQQKFSIPVACVVFAVTGLALGLTVAREGKFAGFVVGIAVIFAYYVVMMMAESLTKGYYAEPQAGATRSYFAAYLARWAPDVAVGIFGILALVWRARYTEGRIPFRLPFRLPDVKRWLPTGRKAAAPGGVAAPASRPVVAGKPRPVVVIRIPHLRVPTPGLLDRYIARIYVRIAALSFLALLGLFYISTFIDKSDKILKGQATTGMVVSLLFYMTPQFVYYVIPIAALLSALVTFGVLSRSSELTVMKACGVSLYRTSVSIVLMSLIFSMVLFSLEQQTLAYANRRADEIDAKIRNRPQRIYDTLNRRWIVGRDGGIYNFVFFDAERNEIAGLTVYRPARDAWKLATTTFTERAVYKKGWSTRAGWVQDFTVRPTKRTPLVDYPLTGLEAPDYFKAEQPLAEMMTVSQLKRYVDDLSASGFNVLPQAVELHKKLAFPFVTFVMTLLAIPFGVTTGRKSTLYGIGLGIVIALAYWITINAFGAIGKSGLLQPALAGWAPNIIVVGVAAYLLLRVRT